MDSVCLLVFNRPGLSIALFDSCLADYFTKIKSISAIQLNSCEKNSLDINENKLRIRAFERKCRFLPLEGVDINLLQF